MYSWVKKYMIGDAIDKAKTAFDIAKLELLFNIILIYIVIYIIGTIPIIVGSYWLIVGVQIIGFLFIIAMGIALKRTESIRLPRQIWFVSGIFFTLSSALLNYGEASFISYAFSMVNVVISFLMLNRFLRNIAIAYYSIFILVTLSISMDIIPRLMLPIDLDEEHAFFEEPNIYAILIAITMILFVIESFLESHQKSAVQVFEQKQKVVQHKQMLQKKNDTVKHSILLANSIQAEVEIDWESIDQHFSDYFYIQLLKESLSGEFFWVRKYKDSIFFALVDTGERDVPGAMLSYMVKNALERAFYNVSKPTTSLILNHANSFLKKTFENVDELSGKISITLCEYSYLNDILSFSGTSEPIIIKTAKQLKAHKPKHSPAEGTGLLTASEVKIQLSKGDVIYLFTDGISEGGITSESKALDYSKFKAKLFSIEEKQMKYQRRLLKEFYESARHQGKMRDNITIVGLKV